MGKIILDQYLIDLGLTEDLFCKAYKFSTDELKDIISLKIIQRKKTVKQNHTKSRENVWEMQLFIDNPSKGTPTKSVPIGMCGNSDQVISQFVEQVKLGALSPSPLSAKNKIKGRGPKKEPFLEWFYRNINHVSKKYLKDLEKEKKGEERKAEEQIRVKKLNKFLQSVSNELDHAIREIQKELNANWEKLYLLETHDFTNLDYEIVHNYGKQDLSFKNFHYSIDSLNDFEKRGWLWVEEMKQYLSEPFVVTEAVITILKLVDSSPKYGVRTYAMWLGNSKAKSLSDKNLDNDFRHNLKNYSIDRIAQKIDDIIYDYDWLQVKNIGYYNNPVLFLTKAGQKILEYDNNNSFSYSQYTQSKPSIENEDKNQDNKKGINNKKNKAQEIKPVELFPYQNLIEHIENQDKKAWINFLSSAQNITQVADWDKYQIRTLSVLLNKNMEGWKAVAKWKLLKHPIKYKNLERLL